MPHMRVLIVCNSNSCRSQMAEAYLQSFDSKLEVMSAGSKPDNQIHPLAIEVMKEDGIDISNKKPKKIDQYLNESFDYVLTLCNKETSLLDAFNGNVQNKIHLNFEDPLTNCDDNSNEIETFRQTRDDIKENFERFYQAHLR